jgi:hypothetical protein
MAGLGGNNDEVEHGKRKKRRVVLDFKDNKGLHWGSLVAAMKGIRAASSVQDFTVFLGSSFKRRAMGRTRIAKNPSHTH